MNISNILSRLGHRLLQTGVALFLFSALEGFVVESLPFPRLGLSVHNLSGFEGVVLIALGLLRPKLNLDAIAARIAFWTMLYSVFATLVPYVLAAAGESTTSRSSLTETVIIRLNNTRHSVQKAYRKGVSPRRKWVIWTLNHSELLFR